MNKKLTSPLKLMISFVLAMILCLSLATPAFATTITGQPKEATDEDHPVRAALTKILKMPVGTTTPTAEFTFKITKESLDDLTTPAAKAEMPEIGTQKGTAPNTYGEVTISYTSTDNPATSTGVKSIPKEKILFDGNTPWPRAGVYRYTIEEVQSHKDSVGTFTNSFSETMTYSKAKYLVSVLVDNHSNGSLYIKIIAAEIIKNEDGIDLPSTDRVKVDPSPGGPSGNGHSNMIFTNTYLKNNGGTDPTDPSKTVLAISKKVDGPGANQSLYFPFKVKVINPDTVVDNNKTYKAYVMEGNVNKTDANNYAGFTTPSPLGAGPYIEFKTGTELDIKLKHNQTLAFIDLPVGSSFEVKELATPLYKPSYVIKLNGDPNGTSQPGDGFNTDLAVPTSPVKYIGEAANSVAFKNSVDQISITGVSLSDLPFIIMIVVVALAIGGYAVIRFRRNAKYNK